MIKLIKYIFKDFYGPFLMGIAGFVVFVSVELLYELSETIVRNQVGFSKLLLLLWYHLPYFVSMGIPVGVLFGIFWLMSRLSNDNEIIAIQTLGIPTKKTVIPFLLITSILCIFTFVLIDNIVPRSNYRAKEAIARYIYQRAEPDALIAENQFVDLGDRRYLFVKEIDRKNGILYDLHLYELSRGNVQIFHSNRAQKLDDKWYMEEGKIFRVNRNGFLDLDVTFDRLELNIGQDVEDFLRFSRGANEMTSAELKQQIETFTRLGVNTSSLIVTYQSKFSNSLAPLVIGLLGVALSLFFNLKSKSWSVLITFILVVLYQGSGAWINALGKERIINPVLAPWIPNLIFGITGIILFLLLDTKISFKLTEPLKKFISLFIFGFIIFGSSSIFSANVTIYSEDFYIQDKIIKLKNSVEIHYKDSIVFSDYAEIFLSDDNRVKYANLKGNVFYQEKEYFIKADEMTVNYEDSESYFINTFTVHEHPDEKRVNVRIISDTTFKPLNQDIIISRGSKLTTCQGKPTYYFNARKVTIYPDRFLIGRDIIIELFGVPVFYFPFYFQNLDAVDDSPFIFTFDYSNDRITVDILLNYRFDNDTTLRFNQKLVNDIDKKQLSLDTNFSYGVPVFDGTLYLISQFRNQNITNLGIRYDFYEKSYVRLSQSDLNIPNVDRKILELSIPKLTTQLGNLEKIKSEIIWRNNHIQYIKFYEFESEAIQQRYRRSNISLHTIKFKSESGNRTANSPLFKSMEEIWENRINDITLRGRYNFYSQYTSLSGTIEYDNTTEGDKILKNGILSNNNLNYKQDYYDFDWNILYLNIGLENKTVFNHRKDFFEEGAYFFGRSLLTNTVTPYSEFNLSLFDFGFSFDYKKVFENNLNPNNRDERNYNDYYGFRFNLFENALSHRLRLNRTIDVNPDKFDFDLSDFSIFNAIYPFRNNYGEFKSIELTTQTNLNIYNLRNTLQTKTSYILSEEPRPNKTEVVLTNIYQNIWNHRTTFEYNHNPKENELNVINITNREIITFNRNNLEIEYDYFFEKDNFKETIPQILTKYSLVIGGNRISGLFNMKNQYDLFEWDTRFIETNSIYNWTLKGSYEVEKKFLSTGFAYETRDKTEKLSFNFRYDIENEKINLASFELRKRLICWSIRFNADIDILPEFNLDSFKFSLFITYIEDKNVEYDINDGFTFGLF